MQVVILAGGLATRMRPATDSTPKSMLPVAGRPFIDWQLTSLSVAGVRQVVLCVGHLAREIIDFVGTGAKWGLDVRYSEDGPDLVGTAGALCVAHARGFLEDKFLVTYGDSYLRLDLHSLEEVRSSSPWADAVMMVFRNRDAFDRSNVALDGVRVAVYAPSDDLVPPGTNLEFIDYGASLIDRSVVEDLGQGHRGGLPEVFYELSRDGRLAAVEAPERFYEIGSRAGLAALESHLMAAPDHARSSARGNDGNA